MSRPSSLPSSVAAIAFLSAALTASFVVTSQASVVTDNPAGWELTFSDEFTGTSLDASKWSHRAPGPRRDAVNVPESVSVKDGLMTITTFTEAGVHKTGMISTQGKFEQAHGYFEARMKFHTMPGQWSAFWLQSPTFGTPLGDPSSAGVEIDVVEHRAFNRQSNPISQRYSSAIHWDGYGDAHQQSSKVHTTLTGMGNDSWHTYGVKWSPSGYEFYFDGELVWSVNGPVSNRAQYLIFSSEVEDAYWAGNIPSGGYGSLAESEANVQVDYVRVYKAVDPQAASADFDGNGVVDGADFLTWQRGMGTERGAVRADGNANAGEDGDVDADDLEVWRRQYGTNGSQAATSIATPEPASVTLLGMAGWSLARRRLTR
jgi:beta-glucanase (GH16 family)